MTGKAPQDRRPWSSTEVAQVTAWHSVGRSDEWIARRLNRTRGSVKNLLQYGKAKPTTEPTTRMSRTCRRCHTSFMSWGPGNRICERCKGEHARLSPLAAPMGNGCHVAGRRTA